MTAGVGPDSATDKLVGVLQGAVTRALEERPGRPAAEHVADALWQVTNWTVAAWRAPGGPRHWAAVALVGACSSTSQSTDAPGPVTFDVLRERAVRAVDVVIGYLRTEAAAAEKAKPRLRLVQ